MKSIEEKAEEYLKNAECFSCGTHLCLITKREHCSVFELHKGRLCNLLKEQQEIDIQRAIEWCDAHTEWDSTFATEGEKSVHNMFIKAMKGEDNEI